MNDLKVIKSEKSYLHGPKPNINYEAVFDLYVIWKSLPRVILSKMSREQMLLNLGIEDELMIELSQIETQEDFREKYNLGQNTLTAWNKKIAERDSLFDIRKWAQPLTKNLMLGMYNHALRKGDAHLMKLWLQTVESWEEKARLVNEYEGVTEFIIGPKAIMDKLNETESKTNKNQMVSDGQTVVGVRVPKGSDN